MSSEEFGIEKIDLDKDELFLAYFELDKLFNKTMDSDLDSIYRHIEKATGYTYKRTLGKREREFEMKVTQQQKGRRNKQNDLKK